MRGRNFGRSCPALPCPVRLPFLQRYRGGADARRRDAPATVICSKTAVGALRPEDVARSLLLEYCFVVYSAFLLFWCPNERSSVRDVVSCFVVFVGCLLLTCCLVFRFWIPAAYIVYCRY
nr:unnamed protein product [Callosobruchus analis]